MNDTTRKKIKRKSLLSGLIIYFVYILSHLAEIIIFKLNLKVLKERKIEFDIIFKMIDGGINKNFF
jgi:hypothetical protein